MGTFPITIRATSGSVTKVSIVVLTVTQPAPANIISPAEGNILTGSTATFSWDSGSGVSQYQFAWGSTPGSSNYYSANTGITRSATVGIPNSSQTQTLYATLSSMISGTWQTRATSYRLTSTSSIAPQGEHATTPSCYVYNDNVQKSCSFAFDNLADAGWFVADTLV
ncbi:MAG TPA: hypothetical protein VK604_26880, partial [Bryobacteraceae bacterium]|nr:hypothetical protein [Bryobacteraceae bacterium]